MDRQDLEDQIRLLMGECGPQHMTIICSRCDERLEQIMRLVDTYADPAESEDLWTAEEVAGYVGKNGAAAGRAWASRNGIARAVARPHPDSGRLQSLYPADKVRAVCTMKGIR